MPDRLAGRVESRIENKSGLCEILGQSVRIAARRFERNGDAAEAWVWLERRAEYFRKDGKDVHAGLIDTLLESDFREEWRSSYPEPHKAKRIIRIACANDDWTAPTFAKNEEREGEA